MYGAGVCIAARRETHEAASFADGIERGDDALEGDRIGRLGELEAASGPAGGSQDSGARECVESFREVIARSASGGGDLLDANRPVVIEDGDAENGMEGLAGGGGEPHGMGGR